MVVGVITTEVLSWHVFHLVVELVSVVPSLREEDAHPVGPVVDEQQGRSEVHSVVIDPSEGVCVGISENCPIGEHAGPVAQSRVGSV